MTQALILYSNLRFQRNELGVDLLCGTRMSAVEGWPAKAYLQVPPRRQVFHATQEVDVSTAPTPGGLC